MAAPSSIVDRLSKQSRTVAPHGMTGAEIDRFSGAGHRMQRYLRDRSISAGELWYLTTAKGCVPRDGCQDPEADYIAFSTSATSTPTAPGASRHGQSSTPISYSSATLRWSSDLRRGAFGEIIQIKPVYDLPGLVNGYQAKERTPQAGFGRKRQLGGRITGSHRLEGGGDRVRLSRELELDAIEQALVEPWQRTNAKRKADRKEYRKRPLTARAPRLCWSDPALSRMSKPVARLQAFGGGYIPRGGRCRD